LSGHSTFSGLLANGFNGGVQTSDNLRANLTLPPVTSLSVFHEVNSSWDVMGSVTYTQWNVLQNIVLENVAGINAVGLHEDNALAVVINEHYRNSWNYSVGANYHVNDQWMLRSGLGYDQTPSNDTDRNLQLPDADRVAVALGTHYQVTKTIGMDLGWTHFFASDANIDVVQTVGPETITTTGSVAPNADVYAFQLTWDIL
jgi:long-chain fatty acid transport protein